MPLPAAREGEACKRKSDISSKTIPQLILQKSDAQIPVIHLLLSFASCLEDLHTTLCSLASYLEVIDATMP